MPRALDITGQKSGYLTAIRCLSSGKGRVWLIRCECGNEQEMLVKRFKQGDMLSCGCKRSELLSKAHKGQPTPWTTAHGLSRHPAYFVWRSMKNRCQLPTHQAWKNYGARGITVCPEWESFEQFWADMGPTYQPGLSIDRIDNDAGYYPTNCRWATVEVQSNNRRTSTTSSKRGRATASSSPV